MLTPRSREGFKAFFTNAYLLLLCRRCEAFQDDSDEEVKEDKTHHQDEQEEVEVG